MKFIYFILILCFVTGSVVSQPKSIDVPADKTTSTSSPYARGEVLKYRVHYGWIDAGEAVLSVTNEKKKIKGRDTYHMVGTGRSIGAFNWFFKVRDRYETYIDEYQNVPLVFIRRVNEGGYIINQDQEFDHQMNIVNSNGKHFDVPDGIQDMLSAFYYARKLDFSTAKEGDEFIVNTFLDDEIFPLKIRYAGREVIKNEMGKFSCRKFHPVVQEGRVFNADKDLSVWISDDNNAIPIRIEAKLFVGSAKMDLKHYEGIAHPIALIDK